MPALAHDGARTSGYVVARILRHGCKVLQGSNPASGPTLEMGHRAAVAEALPVGSDGLLERRAVVGELEAVAADLVMTRVDMRHAEGIGQDQAMEATT